MRGTLSLFNKIQKYSALFVLLGLFSFSSLAYASSTSNLTPESASECSSTPGSNGQTITVSPCTNLKDNQTVNVSGSGFTVDSSGESIGILQCNGVPVGTKSTDQPFFKLKINGKIEDVPVSCTGIENDVISSTNGSFSNSPFKVIEGVTGPALPDENDNTGTAGSVDALKYPCPPTGPQILAGNDCIIYVGDANLVYTKAPITFTYTHITPPSSFRATAVSSATVRLTWDSSMWGAGSNPKTISHKGTTYASPYGGTRYYIIYNSKGAEIAKLAPAGYQLSKVVYSRNISGLKASTPYTFYIRAVDFKGALSARVAASATTKK